MAIASSDNFSSWCSRRGEEWDDMMQLWMRIKAESSVSPRKSIQLQVVSMYVVWCTYVHMIYWCACCMLTIVGCSRYFSCQSLKYVCLLCAAWQRELCVFACLWFDSRVKQTKAQTSIWKLLHKWRAHSSSTQCFKHDSTNIIHVILFSQLKKYTSQKTLKTPPTSCLLESHLMDEIIMHML